MNTEPGAAPTFEWEASAETLLTDPPLAEEKELERYRYTNRTVRLASVRVRVSGGRNLDGDQRTYLKGYNVRKDGSNGMEVSYQVWRHELPSLPQWLRVVVEDTATTARAVAVAHLAG